MKKLIILVFFLSGIYANAQFTIPKVPSFQTSVYDYADILNPTDEKALETKLIRYSDSTTTQIVLITIEDLKGEDIGILTPRWGQEWGIGGSKQNDNGIIILFAKNDRRIWISPGYGVEDRLTAGINGELIRNIIIPEFKAGNFYQGLDKGTDAIFEVLKGKYKGVRKESSKSNNALPFILIIVFVIILLVLASRGNKGGGNFRGGGGLDLGDIIILSSLGRGNGGFGGGSFGGGSSGGFGGGFGGGGFSGGGAGGSW